MAKFNQITIFSNSRFTILVSRNIFGLLSDLKELNCVVDLHVVTGLNVVESFFKPFVKARNKFVLDKASKTNRFS